MELKLLENNSWKEVKEILLFGCGKQGVKVLPTLQKDFDVIGIVDNDQSKDGRIVNGVPVIYFGNAAELLSKYKIVVTVAEYFYKEIKEQLLKMGLAENQDFIMYQPFIMEWYYRYKKKIYVLKTDITITSLCSLKCENCALFMPYWKTKTIFSFEQIKSDMDQYFRCVDYLLDMDIVGGEPFLYKELDELLAWCGQKYRDKIGYLGLITNGTIIPAQSTLDVIKKYKIGVSISDYSDSVGYRDTVDRLCEILEESGIKYTRNKDIQWFDFGFPRKMYCYEGEAVKKHMACCNTICHCISEGRLYYCAVAWAAYRSGLYKDDPRGYLNLSEIDENNLRDRKRILDCCSGNIEGGYIDFCKVCGGFGNDNKNKVKTAVQIKEMD